MAQLGLEKENLEGDMYELKQELEGDVKLAEMEAEASKKRVLELEGTLAQQNKAGALDREGALKTAAELKDLRNQISQKGLVVEHLQKLKKQAKGSGLAPVFLLKVERKRHQTELKNAIADLTDQMDTMFGDYEARINELNQGKGVDEGKIADLEGKLTSVNEELSNLEEKFETADKAFKAGSAALEAKEASLNKLTIELEANGKSVVGSEKVSQLKKQISKMKNSEFYKQNVELRNKMKVFANKAKSVLESLLLRKSKVDGKYKPMYTALAGIVNYAENKGVIPEIKNVNLREFIDVRKAEFNAPKLGLKVGLVGSEQTEKFVDIIAEFFTKVAEKQAQAYDNIQDLDEFRLNNF